MMNLPREEAWRRPKTRSRVRPPKLRPPPIVSTLLIALCLKSFMLGSKLYVHVHFMDSAKTRQVFGVKVGGAGVGGHTRSFCAWLFSFFGAQSTREVVGVFSDETRLPSVPFSQPSWISYMKSHIQAWPSTFHHEV